MISTFVYIFIFQSTLQSTSLVGTIEVFPAVISFCKSINFQQIKAATLSTPSTAPGQENCRIVLHWTNIKLDFFLHIYKLVHA